MSEETLGSMLKYAREQCGLSIEEAELQAEIPKGYLSQLENDEIRQPSTHALWKLAHLYATDLKPLLIAGGIIIKKTDNHD